MFAITILKTALAAIHALSLVSCVLVSIILLVICFNQIRNNTRRWSHQKVDLCIHTLTYSLTAAWISLLCLNLITLSELEKFYLSYRFISNEMLTLSSTMLIFLVLRMEASITYSSVFINGWLYAALYRLIISAVIVSSVMSIFYLMLGSKLLGYLTVLSANLSIHDYLIMFGFFVLLLFGLSYIVSDKWINFRIQSTNYAE